MSTDSTADLENTLRTRLLSFTPLVGSTLAVTLGTTAMGAGSDGKLFWEAAPDNTGPRWGILRLQNRRSEGDGSERERAEMEVMLFARPRSEKATLELCADLCDQAMLRFQEATSLGYVGSVSGRLRSTLPPFVAPADAEVVQIRLLYPLFIYMGYQTQYHAS